MEGFRGKSDVVYISTEELQADINIAKYSDSYGAVAPRSCPKQRLTDGATTPGSSESAGEVQIFGLN